MLVSFSELMHVVGFELYCRSLTLVSLFNYTGVKLNFTNA